MRSCNVLASVPASRALGVHGHTHSGIGAHSNNWHLIRFSVNYHPRRWGRRHQKVTDPENGVVAGSRKTFHTSCRLEKGWGGGGRQSCGRPRRSGNCHNPRMRGGSSRGWCNFHLSTLVESRNLSCHNHRFFCSRCCSSRQSSSFWWREEKEFGGLCCSPFSLH